MFFPAEKAEIRSHVTIFIVESFSRTTGDQRGCLVLQMQLKTVCSIQHQPHRKVQLFRGLCCVTCLHLEPLLGVFDLAGSPELLQ